MNSDGSAIVMWGILIVIAVKWVTKLYETKDALNKKK